MSKHNNRNWSKNLGALGIGKMTLGQRPSVETRYLHTQSTSYNSSSRLPHSRNESFCPNLSPNDSRMHQVYLPADKVGNVGRRRFSCLGDCCNITNQQSETYKNNSTCSKSSLPTRKSPNIDKRICFVLTLDYMCHVPGHFLRYFLGRPTDVRSAQEILIFDSHTNVHGILFF